MPKLTINSICTKGPVYPMIFNFQNGYPSKDFECKCAIIQDDKGKKTIAAEFGRILYVGVEEDENMSQTLLLVRNRKTGKVRLLETGRAELKPIIDNHSKQFTQTSNSEMSQTLQKHLDLETGNLEPTLSPGPQHSELSLMFNNQEKTHPPDNRIVKPVQYLKTSVKKSKTNVERQQLEACIVPNFLHETIIIKDDINSNNPKSDSSKHISKSKPNKKGSTSIFSPKRSGCFRHLYNFFVDEIETIPNDQQSETEHNKSPKCIKHSMRQITNEDANETIRSKELLRDLLAEKRIDVETEQISSENIELTADVGTEELNEANNILSKDLTNILKEKLTNIKTDGLAAEKLNATDRKDLENPDIISIKKLPRVSQRTEIVTEGKESENIQLTLKVPPTKGINKEKTKTASKKLLKNMLEENVTGLESEGIASENELTGVGTEELKEANNIIADKGNVVPPEELLKEDETDLVTEGIAAEDISSTIDIEELSILSSHSLSEDPTSEFEGENYLKSKLDQEDPEDHCELMHENYSIKEYYVAALGLDLHGEKKEHHSYSSTRSDILTNGKTKNDSVRSNQTENIYNCNYCDAVFENKGALIFHLISHDFVMENNGETQSNINNIKGTNIDSENKRNTDFYDRYDELKDGENKRNVYVDIDTKNVLANNEIVTDSDYSRAEFENKDALVFHLTSHEFVNDTDIGTQVRINNNENKNACPENYRNTKDDNGNLDLNENFNDNDFKYGENRKRYYIENNNVTENSYICDYCEVVFEDKGSLIFHLISHKFIKDNDSIAQRKITRVKRNDIDDIENENACSENYANTKKQEKINPYFNAKSKELQDGVNKKRTNTVTTHKISKKELLNNEQGKRIKTTKRVHKTKETEVVNNQQGKRIKTANSEAEIESGTDKITHDDAIKLINCKHCDYKTDDTSDILIHILTHIKDDTNQCEATHICKDCDREFKSEAALIIHIESHKNNSKRKPRTRNTKSDLIDHLTKIHKSTKPYICNLCDFKSSSANVLIIHKQTHKMKPFRCDICKYQCHRNHFVKHMKSHTDSKPFQCQFCDSKFAKNSGLKQHMVTHTGKKEHKCKICDSKFSLLSGLNRHLLIHLKDKPFECAICCAGFKDKSALKRHQKIHTGEKPYKCTHCEYSCVTGTDLKRHMKTHDSKLKQNSSNLKLDSGTTEPFQCTMCDSKFRLKNSLICHMKIHTGEKTNKCTFCDKTFIHFSGLKRHLNVHTKNKPVKCATCNTSYDSEIALRWHLRRSKKHQ